MRCNKVLMIPMLGLLAGAIIFCLSTCSAPTPSPTYIGNIRTHVFHHDHCHYLPDPTNRSYFESRQKVIDAGYRTCRKCKP